MRSLICSKGAAVVLAAITLAAGRAGGEVFSLDSCRAMALSHNKQMMISAERVKKASYQKKEAFAAYVPAFDLQGA